MKVLRGLGFLILLMAAAGGFAVWRLAQPYSGFTGETFVEFPRGTGTRAMGEQLARARVVRSQWEFLLARWASGARVLQAGEYKFDRAASPLAVVRRAQAGEGLN